MTFDISRTWCHNAGIREDGLDVGAGAVDVNPILTDQGGIGEKSRMAFDISKTWCLEAGIREDGLDVGAGVIAADPVLTH